MTSNRIPSRQGQVVHEQHAAEIAETRTFRAMKSLRRGLPSLLLFLLTAALAAPAAAVVFLTLRVENGDGEALRAELTTPTGEVISAADDDGDGELLLLPEAGPGRYDLAVLLGERRFEQAITVPQDGEIVALLNASGEGELSVEQLGKNVFDSEIVVMARRREENLQQVPIAVTALSDDALEARSMRDLTDVGDYTPNLDFSVSGGAGGSPSEATVYLRGVGQIEPGIFADPGVGIYVDGVFIARSQSAVFELLDLDRVEVVRGPQGTLFGKNTTGGAIQLITKKPADQFGGQLSATLGDLDRKDFGLRLTGPLGENLNASLSFLSTERDGFTRSLETGEEFNNDDRQAARGVLRWTPSENTIVDFSADATREREKALNQSLLTIFGIDLLDFYNKVLGDAGFVTVNDSFITGDPTLSHSTFPSLNDGDIFSATLRVSHNWGDTQFLSISNFRDYQYLGSSDFDGTPADYFSRAYDQQQDQISQELQWNGNAWGDRMEWVVGGLYFEENPVDDSQTFTLVETFDALEAAPGPIYAPPGVPDFLCNPGPPPPGLPCFGGAGNPFNFGFDFRNPIPDLLDIETTSWAFFGEADWALNESLTLTTGLRYTYEEKDVFFSTTPPGMPATIFNRTQDWDNVSPRLGLSWSADEDSLLYFSMSRGFKSGGFNAGRSLARTELVPFDQETVWAYEGGFKTEWMDRRLRLNGAAFFYDYDDIQIAAFVEIDGESFLALQNAATGRIEGFELELEAYPRPGLVLNASAGYLDTEYTDLRNSGSAPADGRIPKSPEWNLTAGVQYAWEISRKGSVIARADYSYKTDYFNDVANSAVIEQEAFGLLNVRLVYAPLSDRWELALFGTNLGDEEYLEHGFAALTAGVATGIAGRPQEWGVTFQYRF